MTHIKVLLLTHPATEQVFLVSSPVSTFSVFFFCSNNKMSGFLDIPYCFLLLWCTTQSVAEICCLWKIYYLNCLIKTIFFLSYPSKNNHTYSFKSFQSVLYQNIHHIIKIIATYMREIDIMLASS